MPVIMMYEWNNPKEPERRRKSYDIANKIFLPYYKNKQKEGVKWKGEDYTDGTNTIVGIFEFETMEDFSKIWGDEEFQKMFTRWTYYVDNCKVRILRQDLYLKLEEY